MRCWLLASLAVAILARPGRSQAANPPRHPPMPSIVLEDQFNRKKQLASERGDVIVIIFGDRQAVQLNQDTGSALHVHLHPTARGKTPGEAAKAPVRPIENWPQGVPLPDVRVVPVACVGKVPGVVANLVRSQIRGKSPDVAVYLDFEDQMKRHFGVTAGVSNVVVVDTRGRVRYRGAGKFSNQNLGELARFIEGLRVEAGNP